MQFDTLMRRAEQHHGASRIRAVIEELKTNPQGVTLSDDRILSQMTKSVFCAGFSWKVVETRWDGFEKAFNQFDIGRNALMSDEDLDRLVRNKDIIRHGQKILSVHNNAQFIIGLRKEHGSAARFFSSWPQEDFKGLLQVLKKHGYRLGGSTGQYFLRRIGVPSLIMSKDVVAALVRLRVVDKKPTSQRDWTAVQDVCNKWRDETGLNLSQMSRILALSVG